MPFSASFKGCFECCTASLWHTQGSLAEVSQNQSFEICLLDLTQAAAYTFQAKTAVLEILKQGGRVARSLKKYWKTCIAVVRPSRVTATTVGRRGSFIKTDGRGHDGLFLCLLITLAN